MKHYSLAVILALGMIFSASAARATGNLAACIEHQVSLTIHPANHTARIEDHGVLICKEGWNLLYLKDSAVISEFSMDSRAAEFTFIPDGDTALLPAELRMPFADLKLSRAVGLLLFQHGSDDTVVFHISFTARFDDPVENVRFSRERVGTEVAGTILERGAYLGSSAGYYLQGAETMARFSMVADIPASWQAIADGNPGAAETRGDRRIQRFDNPFVSDGYAFMAAPYVVKTTAVDDITVATYFFAADTSLCDKYLTATADYIRMYQELIGPYPYKQFTVAANFFPTGYGMPGWTLLGQRVLRLPFIITTSLGHEVLHNWWGNSVYVDYDRGNWCEAAAVYGADYRYKLLSSPEAARDYRKDILKAYLSYVDDGNDFPLRQFTSRSSAETRTIGYSKGMMLYHLIEHQIGSEPFWAAWKQVYADYREKAISWEEWLDVFEETSGQDLSHIIPEWIDRAGAPELGLEVTAVTPVDAAGRKTVSLKVTQSADTPYRLKIPIRAEGPGVVESTTVQLTSAEANLDFSVPTSVTTISLDPDYHLFRRLYPEEVEPIISAVLGISRNSLVSCSADPEATGPFGAFGAALLEDSIVVLSHVQLEGVPREHAPVLLNPTTLFPGALAGLIEVTDDSLTVRDETFPRMGHTVVMAGQNWSGFDKYLVILSDDYGSLPRLGQLVPHYGKYSYLVFAGSKNVAKGQWPVTESPLRRALR